MKNEINVQLEECGHSQNNVHHLVDNVESVACSSLAVKLPEIILGGSFNGSQWQWANNRTWVFENWQDGDEPHGGEHLIMNHNGQWEYADGFSFWQPEYLLCQGLTADFKESGPIRLEFNKGKVAFFPLHVTFQDRSSNQGLFNSTT